MDRSLLYTGQLLPAADLLHLARDPMVGLAKLAAAVLGTTTQINGFTCTPTGPASLNVVIGPGEIYALDNVDSTAFGDLGVDNAHQVLKQGLLQDAVQLTVAAPVTAGQSVNYLVQVGLQEVDSSVVVLPYYNSANPAQPFLGPNNSGAAQATRRQCRAVVSLKQGAAAATGTQVTPAPDAGKAGAWVITVANGQTTVVAGNITAYGTAPTLQGIPELLAQIATLGGGRLLGWRLITATGTYNPTAGTKAVWARAVGGGGAGGGTALTSPSQYAIGSGGGAGAFAEGYFTAAFAGITVTIGAAGAAAAGAAGGDGGTTSFGALMSAPGGKGGVLGGAATVGDYSAGLPSGQSSAAAGGNIRNQRGKAGEAALGINLVSSGAGADGPLGTGGSTVTIDSDGLAATGYGAGGGGAASGPSNAARPGGAAGAGLVLIAEFT